MKSTSGLLGIAVALSIVASACSSSTADVPSGAEAGTSGSSGAPDGATPAMDGGPVVTAPTCNGDEGGAVPTSPVALQAWLATRAYQCWTHESVRHASTGPHGGEVQTYLNAKLDASMKTSAEHPEGAVAVKELFGNSGGKDVTGWAVMVKTQPSSANGQGWYWYETFATTPGASSIEGQGKALCVDCHAAGKDHVLIPYPLR